MSVNELEVFRRTEELLNNFYPRFINFPKSETLGLSLHLKNNFFELLKYISLGNNVRSKRLTYLQKADGHLQILKVQVKLAKHRRYISEGFFREIDLELTMINKLLSGYIRSVNKKR